MAECQALLQPENQDIAGSGALQPDRAGQARLLAGAARQADAEAVEDIKDQAAAVEAVDIAAPEHIGNPGQAHGQIDDLPAQRRAGQLGT